MAKASRGIGGGRLESGNVERNKKELTGTKRKPRLWGVVVVNPHLRVRSATTLPSAFYPSSNLSFSFPLLPILVFSGVSPLFFLLYLLVSEIFEYPINR